MGYYTSFYAHAFHTDDVSEGQYNNNRFSELHAQLEQHKSAAKAVIDGKVANQEEVDRARAIYNAIDEMSYAILPDGDCGEQCKWYDFDKHMVIISKLTPEYVIQLNGIGEEHDDCWTTFYHNGRSKYVKREVPVVRFAEHVDFVYGSETVPVLLTIKHIASGQRNFQLLSIKPLSAPEWVTSGMEPMYHNIRHPLMEEYEFDIQILPYEKVQFLVNTLGVKMNGSFLPVPFELEASHVFHYGLIFERKVKFPKA